MAAEPGGAACRVRWSPAGARAVHCGPARPGLSDPVPSAGGHSGRRQRVVAGIITCPELDPAPAQDAAIHRPPVAAPRGPALAQPTRAFGRNSARGDPWEAGRAVPLSGTSLGRALQARGTPRASPQDAPFPAPFCLGVATSPGCGRAVGRWSLRRRPASHAPEAWCRERPGPEETLQLLGSQGPAPARRPCTLG